MTQEIIIALLSSSFIWIMLLLIIISNLKHKNLEALKNKEIAFEKEKNLIFDQMRAEKQTEFDKGYISGSRESDFVIHIEAYKNIDEKKGYFQKKQIMEIGYVYRLFVKGVPSLDPHIQIVERIKLNELNEQNVNVAIIKLDAIINKIPSSHLKLAGNIKNFGKEILKTIKTERK